MTNNSTNGASYLILSSLSDGSKYGLEIIEHISNRTGGHYIMKKPTLYSALTRMEKKGLVSSSYWQTSDMGGKRHYYTITSAGRKELEVLEVEFKDATFDDVEEPSIAPSETPALQAEGETPTTFGWQDSLFNIVGSQSAKEQPAEEKVEENASSQVVENQLDMFSNQESASTSEETENSSQETSDNQQKMEYYQSILEQQPSYIEADAPIPQKSDDGVLLDNSERLTEVQAEQNQRIYDNSSDLKRFRKHKSFAENQIEMAVDYETEEDREIQKERIENLKSTLLNFKQNKNEQILKESEPAPVAKSEPTFAQSAPVSTFEPTEPERLDDAVFITSRYEESEIPVQKKITPPNIDVDVSDSNLPAPKRNTNLEPTYKDMMAKLFERKKEKEKLKEENEKVAREQATQQQSQQRQAQTAPQYESGNYNDLDSFADYNTLQRYYAERGINFKEYKKTTVVRNHNTNFLQFISSVVLLFLSGVGSAVIYGIVAGCHLLNANTNFLFYTVPCIFALYVLFTFVRHKAYPSKKASLTYNAVINWAVFLLSVVVILVVNIICGMQYEIFGKFLTSILVPAYAMLLAFPCNYYVKKFLYKRYAR